MAPKTKAAPMKMRDYAEHDPLVGTRMRVWWPPTANKERTGFSGAYWPVRVVGKKPSGKYAVEYDNGEIEDVITENLAPDDPPVDFGQELTQLQPGEFCEVSNDSKTDPCAWVGMVAKYLSSGKYYVKYPFHDATPEEIPPHLIRRARVLDMEGWCLLKPNQKWRDGDVLSPHELISIKEEDLEKYVEVKKAATATNGSHEDKKAPNNKRSAGQPKPAAGTKKSKA